MVKFTWKCDGNNPKCRHCTLKSSRCEAIKPNGKRCKNKSVRTYGICWQHLRQIEHLNASKKSSIPGAGDGLFAYARTKKERDKKAVVFRKGQRIGWYHGELLTPTEHDKIYGNHTAPYTVKHRDKKDGVLYVDSSCIRSTMAQANGTACEKKKRRNKKLACVQWFHGTKANAVFRGKIHPLYSQFGGADRNSIAVKATKTIRSGDEIIIDYGKSYDFSEPACSHRTYPARRRAKKSAKKGSRRSPRRKS